MTGNLPWASLFFTGSLAQEIHSDNKNTAREFSQLIITIYDIFGNSKKVSSPLRDELLSMLKA